MNEQTSRNVPYYIGLDIGTSSVGWCCTDSSYKWLRYHGKNMCGVRLFSEAETAKERRMHRSNRRRLKRRNKRIAILRAIFAGEIQKVEPEFYASLDESRFTSTSLGGLMAPYPTIFHLRKVLIEQPETKFDIRLIYLACANILKHRGNFLCPSLSVENAVEGVFEDSFNFLMEHANELDINLSADAAESVKSVLLENNAGVKETAKALQQAFGSSDKRSLSLFGLIAGGTLNFKELFDGTNNEFDAESVESFKKIKLSDSSFEEKALELESTLGDAYKLIEGAKRLYDWSKLGKLLKGHKTLSSAFVAAYDNSLKECSHPIKTRTADNGVIPYQLHAYELDKILENASKHYSFLLEQDKEGYSNIDKIKSMLSFKIPYYAGTGFRVMKPGFSKKSIHPWNFDKIVDLSASAERFIRSMTKKCQFIPTCDVLPKNSLLYAEYIALNQINTLMISGEKLSPEQKSLVWESCHQQKNLTYAGICKLLNIKKNVLQGIDKDATISLKSYYDFKKIIGDIEGASIREFVEQCIYNLTIFGKEKTEIQRRIVRDAIRLAVTISKEQIRAISRLEYSGWGSFSKELLTDIKDNGVSIIDALKSGNENFMQLLSKRHNYSNVIDAYNKQHNSNRRVSRQNLLETMYASPAVKRSVTETLSVLDDIIRRQKRMPSRIFVEIPRESSEKNQSKKGKKTVSRKEKILKIYHDCSKDTEIKVLKEELDNIDESALKKDKVYLYFMQIGRCMYSGEKIDLQKLLCGNTEWDIDHIYPQSKVIDDSLTNRVLVKKTLNGGEGGKGDNYLCETDIVTPEAKQLWEKLSTLGLLSANKRERLTRKTPLSADELAAFNSRQLVETQQAAKAVCDIIKELYDSDNTKVVYVNADRVSDFRKICCYVKCRDINDLHHAKDAYLNIVVGNVWYTRLTSNPAYVFGHERINVQYTTKNKTGLLDRPMIRNGVTAWEPETSWNIVDKWMHCNQILSTRQTVAQTGAFYDQNPIKGTKCKPGVQIPLKFKDPRFLDMTRCGGYDNQRISYFQFIEYTKGKKVGRVFIPIPIRLAKSSDISAYIESLEYDKVDVLLKKVLIGAKIIVNGYPMVITGRSQNRFLVNQAAQLIISEDDERYLNRVLKCADERLAESKLSADGILRLYDLFQQKLTQSIFAKRPNNQAKTLQNGRDKFAALGILEQCKALKNILVLFSSNRCVTDLALIGGSKNAGSISVNMDISKYDTVVLEEASATGLGSVSIDLKNLKNSIDRSEVLS